MYQNYNSIIIYHENCFHVDKQIFLHKFIVYGKEMLWIKTFREYRYIIY